MIRSKLFPLFFLISAPLFAQQVGFRYEIDLNYVAGDRVRVEAYMPAIEEASALFYFPATVPGTYATLDYGRLITNLHAYDADGNELETEWGGNVYSISKAQSLHHISYEVHDSYDASFSVDPIFEPAGSNIEANKNFLINSGAFFGCLTGKELTPFEINIKHPDQFYGVTSLPKTTETTGLTKLVAESYHHLIDNPMMFSEPDTASLTVRNTRIDIGVYCTSGEKVASEIRESIRASMEATGQFFDTLPVDHYTFILYLPDMTNVFKKIKGPFKKIRLVSRFLPFAKMGFGALEHGQSSLYHMPYVKEIGEPMLSVFAEDLDIGKMLEDVAIHEFLHILTPLSLHAEQIGNFNYTDPWMSRHLWLYEGSTEYHADFIRLQGGLINERTYFEDVLRSKISNGLSFPATEMSFTEMSKNVLEKKYHEEYPQVYEYGALMSLLIDIEIIRLTKGEKRLKTVLFELMRKYGKDKSFDDETFITEFVAAAHPELQEFFDKYVSGKNQLDLGMLNLIGYEYHKEKEIGVAKSYISDNDIVVKRVSEGYKVTSAGKNEWAGLKKKDIILMNDENENIYKIGEEDLKEGEKAVLQIIRAGTETTLEFNVVYKKLKKKNHLVKIADLNEEQQMVKNAWLTK